MHVLHSRKRIPRGLDARSSTGSRGRRRIASSRGTLSSLRRGCARARIYSSGITVAMSAASSSPHVCASRSVFSKMGAIFSMFLSLASHLTPRERLLHSLLSEAKSRLYTPSRRNFSRRACGWIYALQNFAPSFVHGCFTRLYFATELAGSGYRARVLSARRSDQAVARHSTGWRPHRRRWRILNSAESPLVPAGRHPKPSAASRRDANKAAAPRRSTPSSSFITAAKGCPRAKRARHLQVGCPTRHASITDPLTVALGGAKPLPETASQWQGWCVTDLRTDGGWRRSSLVVNGDGLGSDEVALSIRVRVRGPGHAGRRRAQPGAAVAAARDLGARRSW